MSQDAPDGSSDQSLQGAVFHPRSHEELLAAIEKAFDYRGDVTLELTSHEVVSGYIFNRVSDGPRPCLELFPLDRPGSRTIAYRDIRLIRMTGQDTASGKSWEAWVQKKQEAQQSPPATQ